MERATNDGGKSRVHHQLRKPVLLTADAGRADHRLQDLERNRLKPGQGRLLRSGAAVEDRDEGRHKSVFKRDEATGCLGQDPKKVLS